VAIAVIAAVPGIPGTAPAISRDRPGNSRMDFAAASGPFSTTPVSFSTNIDTPDRMGCLLWHSDKGLVLFGILGIYRVLLHGSFGSRESAFAPEEAKRAVEREMNKQ